MKEHNLQGTIRYYGCPAEENAGGKAFLVRDGYFNVTWLFAGTRSRGGVHATEVPRQISEYFLHSTELRLMHPCVPNWAALHWMQ